MVAKEIQNLPDPFVCRDQFYSERSEGRGRAERDREREREKERERERERMGMMMSGVGYGRGAASGSTRPPVGPHPHMQSTAPAMRDKRHRWFVALFDYDPTTMSPNPDACEEELPFTEGDIIKVSFLFKGTFISALAAD